MADFQDNDYKIDILVEIKLIGSNFKEALISISSENELIRKLISTNLEGKFFGFDFIDDFTVIPYEMRSFLLLFKTYNHNLINRKEKNSLEISFPIDALFLEKLLTFKPKFLIGDKQVELSLSKQFYPLEIEYEGEANILAVKKYKNLFLLQTNSQDFVVEGNTIYPVLSLLNKENLLEIFTSGYLSPDYDLKLKLFSRKAEKKEWMEKFFRLPEVREIDDEKIVFYFDHKEKDKFFLKAFFSFIINGKSEEYPFNFEEYRKSILLQENIIIPVKNDLIFISKAGTGFYDKISRIVSAVNKNFFEILNEIDRNTIFTPDSEALFQKFLPAVGSLIELRGVHSGLTYIQDTFQEKKIELLRVENKNLDWLEVNFKFKIKDIILTINELSHLLKDGFVSKEGFIISIPAEEMLNLNDLFSDIRLKKEHDKVFISRYNLPSILKDAINITFPEELKNLPEEFGTAYNTKKSLQEIEIPGDLTQVLREYQKTGVYWLNFLNRYGFGGILADEMGLGKTIQVLAFLLAHKGIHLLGNYISRDKNLGSGDSITGTALIVCPTALLYNWTAEIQKFIGLKLSYMVIDGSKAERIEKLKNILHFDIAITSYQLLHNDIEIYKTIDFDYCILDEAQHIKNKHAKRTLSVKDISAKNRLAVTGTPIENNVSELWSIFDFLMPDFLGNHVWFKKSLENSLNSFNLKEKNKSMDKLKRLIKPFILRRTKANVLKELPAKIEQDIQLELTEKQKAIYLETLSKIKNNYFKIVESKGFENTYLDFLAALTRLRQICLHPGLMNPDLISISDSSIKLKALMELIFESIDSDHRVAIFSQFVEMLKIIRKELHDEEIEYLYLDGQTKNRVELVNHFNETDIPVFLISLKAGGTGLNLIGADSVILFDPWWNPAVENQAIDRVHRIGQVNTVHVYRLMTKGTIEEKIKKLQSYKREIFDNLVTSNQSFIKNMNWRDIQELFEME